MAENTALPTEEPKDGHSEESSRVYPFCNSLVNCVQCRTNEDFRKNASKQLNLGDNDFPCHRGVAIGTTLEEMPDEIKIAVEKMQNQRQEQLEKTEAARKSLKYLLDTQPAFEEQLKIIKEFVLPPAVEASKRTADKCIHSGEQTGEVDEECCGGKIKKVASFSCEKHEMTTDKKCKKCDDYSPKIIEKAINTPTKLIIVNGQAPGDGVMLSHAIASLHQSHPGKFITDVRCPYGSLFEGNPYITHIEDGHEDLKWESSYNTVNQSNQKPVHYVNSFSEDLSAFLGVPIKPADFRGFVYIRDEEKGWYSAVNEELAKRGVAEAGRNPPFWIINAGYKKDFTAKQWLFERYQKVVDDNPDIWFAQIGHQDHIHPELKGDNVINLVGKTDLRQLIRLIWHSFGVITPVSMPMVMSYALDPHPRYRRKARACIVISGGREPNHWQQGPDQHLLHTGGMLDCCDHGGCWKSRVVPLGDGDKDKENSLCLRPVEHPSGQTVAKCMTMISADEVTALIRKYMENL